MIVDEGGFNVLKYLKLDSGKLHNEPSVRYVSIYVQMGMLFVFSIFGCMYNYWWDTEGFFSTAFWGLFSIFSFLSMVYFTVAFYLSIRDNLPRLVKLKHSMGLFLFTLLFFEGLVMCFLFWFLYIVLSFAGTPLCYADFCTGLISGLFYYVNSITIICSIVLYRVRGTLGISISDAFGLDVD
eukprot:TRINITY_DN4362_c0_g1_i1.p1 TRINITY_DN4362_c0_g1~~TRINITY_DN4362_c0_g1_i1.p1  ORF type:complete len:182 (+),score=5.62 TRINITY_DN4362_c0_g1_i1:49-594(+)